MKNETIPESRIELVSLKNFSIATLDSRIEQKPSFFFLFFLAREPRSSIVGPVLS